MRQDCIYVHAAQKYAPIAFSACIPAEKVYSIQGKRNDKDYAMATNKYLDAFMKQFPYEGLTYDDVTLVTQYADFLPDDASLETSLTSRQKMKIPFMSAAMDTVTEAPMAIAMALAGGIGVIHKNLEEDDQAKQVAKVKNYLNGLIAKPICFHEHDDISYLRDEKRQRGYKFNGFPVLDDQ